ncbi:MAG: hypothetical protein CL927_13240 [Deltaproteobacteria bacterium]|nr:hypothetical protein [Deltaproteobacteria bacterium]HCH63450.1 hypothetical protein [Deltaproteobacteria bacterium]
MTLYSPLAGSVSGARSHPKGCAALDLSPAVARTLLAFKATQSDWSESAIQDAIESVRMISWWRQVRFGVHVPLHTLYATTVQRLARREVEQFALRQAPRIGVLLGMTPSTLQRIAIHTIGHSPLPTTGPNPRIHRLWNESELPWRRRFEHQLRSETHRTHALPLVDWVETTSLTIVSTWNRAHRTRLVSRRTTR